MATAEVSPGPPKQAFRFTTTQIFKPPEQDQTRRVDELYASALQFQRDLNIRNAIKCYEEILKIVPDDSRHQALSGKLWSDATYLDEINSEYREVLSKEEKNEMSIIALERAREAMRLDRDDSLPEVIACLATARLMMYAGPRSKGRLLEEGLAYAQSAVAKGPEDDYAHHLMGRWNWELSQVKAVKRTLARLALRTRLPCTKESDAIESFSIACKLAPEKLIHRAELGKTLFKMGQKERAWRELETAVQLDVSDINAHLEKLEVQALLDQLRPMAEDSQWKLHTEPDSH